MNPTLLAVLNRLHGALQWLLAASVAVLIVPVMMQILSRYIGFIPRYIWTEELARFCFIWMIMIGAMIAVREDSHFDVDLWPPLPAKANAALRIITHIAMLVFAIVSLFWLPVRVIRREPILRARRVADVADLYRMAVGRCILAVIPRGKIR